MQKVINMPSGVAAGCTKKREAKKRTSPYNPYREKAKGKETSPGSCENPLSPRARARDGVGRYRLAGGAAEELVEILGIRRDANDVRLWAFYCYHFDIERIMDKAYECASMARQGELRNPVTAFQHWLGTEFGGRTGGAR